MFFGIMVLSVLVEYLVAVPVRLEKILKGLPASWCSLMHPQPNAPVSLYLAASPKKVGASASEKRPLGITAVAICFLFDGTDVLQRVGMSSGKYVV